MSKVDELPVRTSHHLANKLLRAVYTTGYSLYTNDIWDIQTLPDGIRYTTVCFGSFPVVIQRAPQSVSTEVCILAKSIYQKIKIIT